MGGLRGRHDPVGAVLADRDGRVLARGRNRIYDTSRVDGQIAGTRLAHAEVNALLGITRSDLDPLTLALYTTAEPCPLCVGATVIANVRVIHYASREPFAGSIALLETTPYIRSKAITVHSPFDADLEAALTALGSEFHLRHGGRMVPELIAVSRRANPRAVALAERLHAGGAFDELAKLGPAEGLTRLVRALDSPLEGV
jgi:tRNA(Arg) A34 adenosine deaminase TadA